MCLCVPTCMCTPAYVCALMYIHLICMCTHVCVHSTYICMSSMYVCMRRMYVCWNACIYSLFVCVMRASRSKTENEKKCVEKKSSSLHLKALTEQHRIFLEEWKSGRVEEWKRERGEEGRLTCPTNISFNLKKEIRTLPNMEKIKVLEKQRIP